MLVSATLVSTSFTVGEAIADALDPKVLTLIRFLLAALFFAPLVQWKYGLRFSWSLYCRCCLISGCMTMFFTMMFYSLRYTSGLHISIIFALVPAFSWLFSHFINSERLTKRQLIALFFGLAGVIWVLFRGRVGLLFAMHWNRGDLIFVFGCLFIALYAPLVKLFHQGEPMAVMTFWVLVSGAMWLLIFSGRDALATNFTLVPLQVWAGICYLAIFTTIITFFLTQYSVTYLGPTKVTAYSYLYPSLVLVIDLLLGKGLPPLRVFPGIVLVLMAMIVLMGYREKDISDSSRNG